MGSLTRNFSFSEFRCHCGCEEHDVYLNNIKALAERLQLVRDAVGAPIIVTSGFRCPHHDEAEWRHSGGTGVYNPGFHSFGRAADVWTRGLPLLEFWNAALPAFQNGGMGLYTDYNILHLDTGPARTWGHVGGQYTSLEVALAQLKGKE